MPVSLPLPGYLSLGTLQGSTTEEGQIKRDGQVWSGVHSFTLEKAVDDSVLLATQKQPLNHRFRLGGGVWLGFVAGLFHT